MQLVANGVIVRYEVSGTESGKSLLMLHGWGNDLSSFDALYPLLSIYKIIRVDLPGFGASKSPISAWSVQDYALCVRDICNKLSIKPNIIIGHSFGGRIAMRGVADNLLHPNTLVLIASAGVARRKTLRNLSMMIFAKIAKLLTSIYPLYMYRHRIRVVLYRALHSDYATTGKLQKTFIKVISEDLSDAATMIKIPTLLIWGGNDIATPLSEGQRLHKLINNSKLEVMDSCSHFVHQENPKDVSNVILSWLASAGV